MVFFKIKKGLSQKTCSLQNSNQILNITFPKARSCNYVGDTLKIRDSGKGDCIFVFKWISKLRHVQLSLSKLKLSNMSKTKYVEICTWLNLKVYLKTNALTFPESHITCSCFWKCDVHSFFLNEHVFCLI